VFVHRYNDWLDDESGHKHAAVFAAADGADVTVPGLTAVSISSSNAASATAKAGDTLLLSMQTDEPILMPTVTINGHDVTVTAPHQSIQVPFQSMPGCSGGYETILDLALCNAAKAVLAPTFTGVNNGGFGSEWSDGCFFNGNAVYFHDVGADHRGYGGFSATHQTLCVLKTGTPSLYTSSTRACDWVDITGTGTKIENSEFSSGSDDGLFVFSMPFAHPYYGRTTSEMHISTNGYITFGPGHYAYGNSLPIPTPGGAIGGVELDGIIGIFWADLHPGATGAASDSGVYYSGDAESVTVTYNKINFFDSDNNGLAVTFQGIFFPSGEFHLQYKEMPSAGQCNVPTTIPANNNDDSRRRRRRRRRRRARPGPPTWVCGNRIPPSIGYENHDGTLGEQLAYGWEDSALSGGGVFAFEVSPSFLPAFDEQVPFKAMPGCSGGYETILDLARCNAANAALAPTFTKSAST
jgi:hypothetical protein